MCGGGRGSRGLLVLFAAQLLSRASRSLTSGDPVPDAPTQELDQKATRRAKVACVEGRWALIARFHVRLLG